jgi:large subunit ribosomal protein L35
VLLGETVLLREKASGGTGPMPKQKTNKSAAKRFRVTRRGKVLRRAAGHGHLLAHKSTKRKRKMKRAMKCAPLDAKRIKRLLGFMG